MTKAKATLAPKIHAANAPANANGAVYWHGPELSIDDAIILRKKGDIESKEEAMKFFTAKLYQQFNSADVDEAERAEEFWEKSQRRYEERLQKIRNRFPHNIRQLADKVCLHDAKLLCIHEGKQALKLLLLQGNRLFDLSYKLIIPIKKTAPIAKHPFSPHGEIWLYDEVDMLSPGRFTHQILLSSGREIMIEFSEFNYAEMEINPVGTMEVFQNFASTVQKAKLSAQKARQVKLSKEDAEKMIAVFNRMSEPTTTRNSTEFEFNPPPRVVVGKIEKKRRKPSSKMEIPKRSGKS